LEEVGSVYSSDKNIYEQLKNLKAIQENMSNMSLREIVFGDVDWIHWAQDRDRRRAVVNTVMNLRVP
jgi:hypothetical protein